jgi:hypothetical protein
LARIRTGRDQILRSKPDLSLLWAEVMGAADVESFLFLRLRRALEAIEAHLRESPQPVGASRTLQLRVLSELSDSEVRIRGASGRTRPVLAVAGR